MTQLHVRGCEIYYDVLDLVPPWVSAPESVLFHHGVGATSGIWAEWVPLLAGRFRIVRFDMRGHGRSSSPPLGASVTMEMLTDDVLAVADAANARQFHMVGESKGGTIAICTALRASERVLTATVSNGTHVGGAIQAADNWRRIIDESGMEGWSRHMMQCRFFEGRISDDIWQWYEREQTNVSPHVLLDALSALIATDLSPDLRRLAMPVLLLHTDSSPFISVETMADLRARIPGSRLQVFPHARHGLPVSHAAECATAVARFLAESAPVRAAN